MLRLKILYNLFVRGKRLSNKWKKIFDTFVLKLLLKLGLNNIMFHCLFNFGLAVVLVMHFMFTL